MIAKCFVKHTNNTRVNDIIRFTIPIWKRQTSNTIKELILGKTKFISIQQLNTSCATPPQKKNPKKTGLEDLFEGKSHYTPWNLFVGFDMYI